MSERKRAATLGLPLRTYQDIRLRAYLGEWVVDRYIPDLSVMGVPDVTVALAQPHMDEILSMREAWMRDPSTVLAWGVPGGLLGVFVHSESRWKAPLPAGQPEPGESTSQERMFSVTINTRSSAIPAYFDFEGLWSQVTNLSEVPEYPRSLLSSTTNQARPLRSLRDSLSELAKRPFQPGQEDSTLVKTLPYFLPRSQQRALANGLATRRVFLDPVRLPELRDCALKDIVMVYGNLQTGHLPESLFRTLRDQCQVHPFLFVTDGFRTLVGTVSVQYRFTDRRVPLGRRRSVMGTLLSFLTDVRVEHCPLREVKVLVNHRYDRLVR